MLLLWAVLSFIALSAPTKELLRTRFCEYLADEATAALS